MCWRFQPARRNLGSLMDSTSCLGLGALARATETGTTSCPAVLSLACMCLFFLHGWDHGPHRPQLRSRPCIRPSDDLEFLTSTSLPSSQLRRWLPSCRLALQDARVKGRQSCPSELEFLSASICFCAKFSQRVAKPLLVALLFSFDALIVIVRAQGQQYFVPCCAAILATRHTKGSQQRILVCQHRCQRCERPENPPMLLFT